MNSIVTYGSFPQGQVLKVLSSFLYKDLVQQSAYQQSQVPYTVSDVSLWCKTNKHACCVCVAQDDSLLTLQASRIGR